MEAGCGSVRDWVLSYSTWNARRPSAGLMLDGDANAAPAPKIVAPVASTEKAMDTSDRFASTRLFAADELSSLTAMRLRLGAKGKESLSELDEFADES
jgi:hypothetical protein